MSGVVVHADCNLAFQRLAEGKKEYRYIIFRIKDHEVIVEKCVRPEEMQNSGQTDYDDNSKAAYEEFLQDLKQLTENFSDCRYAVFDFKFTRHREGAGLSKSDKIVFFQICPDGSAVKRKMVYASSAQAMKDALGTGKIFIIQVSEENDMDHKVVLKALMDKAKG